MSRSIRRTLRLDRPTAIALLALFVALGGTSYAAVTITGKNIKNSTVTSADIKNNSLKGSDVKNGSLRAADFKAGDLPKGPKGEQGEKGSKGDKGDAGTARAYATINKMGIASKTFNFLGISVTKDPDTASSYCLDVPFAVKNVQATIQAGGAATGVAAAIGKGSCPSGTDVNFRTYDADALLTDGAFMLLLN